MFWVPASTSPKARTRTWWSPSDQSSGKPPASRESKAVKGKETCSSTAGERIARHAASGLQSSSSLRRMRTREFCTLEL